MKHPLLAETTGVYFIDMHSKIHEQVISNEDGSFSIFINSRLNYEQRIAAYQHALAHIINDDFSKFNVDSIESAAE